MPAPEETSEAVHSAFTVDQISGHALKVKNFKTDSNRLPCDPLQPVLHTGDVPGTPTHIIASLSSLLLSPWC